MEKIYWKVRVDFDTRKLVCCVELRGTTLKDCCSRLVKGGQCHLLSIHVHVVLIKGSSQRVWNAVCNKILQLMIDHKIDSLIDFVTSCNQSTDCV